MLLLDPHSDQVKYRAEAMEKPADWVKVEILEELQTLCRISSRLEERDNHNLEVKVYDAAPTNHIYDFGVNVSNVVGLVSPLLGERPSSDSVSTPTPRCSSRLSPLPA